MTLEATNNHVIEAIEATAKDVSAAQAQIGHKLDQISDGLGMLTLVVAASGVGVIIACLKIAAAIAAAGGH